MITMVAPQAGQMIAVVVSGCDQERQGAIAVPVAPDGSFYLLPPWRKHTTLPEKPSG
jgi:hypothetical protein